MGNSKYTRYQKHGIYVEIPSHLKVKMEDATGFYAVSKDERSSMIIEVNPVQSRWDAAELMMRQPLGVDPLMRMESRILREGPIEIPYPGYERVVEHFMKATGETDFGWFLNCVAESTRIIFNVSDFFPFVEQESLWTDVVQSLRVKDN